MKIIAFALVFFIHQSAMAQIYMWTDKNGVKHYTNTAPPPEAVDTKEEGEAVHVEPTPTERSKMIKEEANRSSQKRIDVNKKNIKKKSVVATPAEPYRISHLGVYKDGDYYIKVSGRISGGEDCSRLKGSLYLHSDQGGTAHVNFVVENVGRGSRLFESRDYVGSSRVKDDWGLGKIYYRCIEK